MTTQLTDLTVREVSLVDRPANPGARLMLFKRAEPKFDDVTKAYLDRKIDKAELDKLVEAGVAMKGGAFPISDVTELQCAIKAVEAAKDRKAARAHIVARAEALKLGDHIPGSWKPGILKRVVGALQEAAKGLHTPVEFMAAFEDLAKEMGDARTFDQVLVGIEAGEYASGMMNEIDEACMALRMSVSEIMNDEAVKDKIAAIDETFGQFRTHLQGVVPEELEKALAAGIAAVAGAAGPIGKGAAMSAELKKALGLEPTATDAQVMEALGKAQATSVATITKLETELKVAKLSPDQRAYYDALKADDKPKFLEDDEEEKKNKVDASKLQKSASDIAIEKANATAAAAQAEVAKMRDEQDKATIVKRADTELTNIGKADDVGAVLHGIAKLSPELAKQAEALLKSADEKIAKGALFSELGSTRAGETSATKAIQAKATELQKANRGMTIEKARTQVRNENPDLAKQENDERAAQRRSQQAA